MTRSDSPDFRSDLGDLPVRAANARVPGEDEVLLTIEKAALI
jgi:hypothetical protein